jgi:hypothetical protein
MVITVPRTASFASQSLRSTVWSASSITVESCLTSPLPTCVSFETPLPFALQAYGTSTTGGDSLLPTLIHLTKDCCRLYDHTAMSSSDSGGGDGTPRGVLVPGRQGPSVDLGHRLGGVLVLAMHLGFAEVERFPEAYVAIIQRHARQGSPAWLEFAFGE